MTSPDGAFASLSPGAPAAEAFATALALEELSAWKPTAPPAERLRLVPDSTRWSAKVSAIAIPTAASPPSVSPSAVVSAEAVSSALASIAPVTGIASPVPITARLETLWIVTATAGATATCALFAPVFACATSVCTSFARSVRSSASDRVAPFSIAARAWSLTTEIAIEAPTPTDSGVGPPASSSAGSAFTVELETDSAFSSTSSVAAPSSFASASSVEPVERRAVVVTV